MRGEGDSKESLELFQIFAGNYTKVKFVCWMACTCFSFAGSNLCMYVE